MISHKHKCVFVHIPKTAGQSVEHVFLEQNGLTWEGRAPLLLRPNDDLSKGPERLAHLYADEYVKFDYMEQDAFDQYYKFAFVRNPFDRLVSEYRYRNLDSQYNFKDFVLKHLPAGEMTNDFRHIVPQSRYVYDSEGNCLVDFVGKFESIQSDFSKVCSALNLPSLELPHNNKSKAKQKSIWLQVKSSLGMQQKAKKISYQEFYDSELQELVSTMYQDDLKHFDYSF
ncbi:sulfotransferase family 2 domain-containing protein [Echinimonas agarilytica]|uniref:Sulfotransferase family protein n=1 Tax=Echinimonas agarilytica TaxID=1215918 RepID=A0AA41WAF8_9GAMM|nr:sulfotransferase family 2 domain-containing protein [Echinimonas agarilytica]MCM2681481.1 sulfotransferase family protein [Echinimonas agarilytica]